MFALGMSPPVAVLEIRKDFLTLQTSTHTPPNRSEPTLFPTMLIIYYNISIFFTIIFHFFLFFREVCFM